MHQTKVKHLRSQLLQISEEEEREIEARKAMKADLRNRMTNFSKRIAALESELADKKHTNMKGVPSLQIEELTIKLEELTVIQEITIRRDNSKSQIWSWLAGTRKGQT